MELSEQITLLERERSALDKLRSALTARLVELRSKVAEKRLHERSAIVNLSGVRDARIVRAQTAAKMRAEGATYKVIGDALGVGAGRASQIVAHAEHLTAETSDPFDMLSVRAANSLWSSGLRTVDDVRSAWNLSGSRRGFMRDKYGMGIVSAAEIELWLARQK